MGGATNIEWTGDTLVCSVNNEGGQVSHVDHLNRIGRSAWPEEFAATIHARHCCEVSYSWYFARCRTPVQTFILPSVRLAALALAIITTLPAHSAPVSVYLIGDSTVADKPDPEHNPERGWGQALPALLGKNVVVHNHAVNGRSTKSFIAEGRWETVRSLLRTGDYVLIQFGHNDEKVEDSTRYAAPNGAYRQNLERFVLDARRAGARPVLITPIVRRQWSSAGELTDTHGLYPLAVRTVVKSERVALIDLQELTAALLRGRGVEESKLLFVWTTEGQFPAFPAARTDNTHLSPAGAMAVAELVVRHLPEMLRKDQPRKFEH